MATPCLVTADQVKGIVQSCTNFIYVEFDPDVHVEGQPAAGSGTTADPFQIPVTCCPTGGFF